MLIKNFKFLLNDGNYSRYNRYFKKTVTAEELQSIPADLRSSLFNVDDATKETWKPVFDGVVALMQETVKTEDNKDDNYHSAAYWSKEMWANENANSSTNEDYSIYLKSSKLSKAELEEHSLGANLYKMILNEGYDYESSKFPFRKFVDVTSLDKLRTINADSSTKYPQFEEGITKDTPSYYSHSIHELSTSDFGANFVAKYVDAMCDKYNLENDEVKIQITNPKDENTGKMYVNYTCMFCNVSYKGGLTYTEFKNKIAESTISATSTSALCHVTGTVTLKDYDTACPANADNIKISVINAKGEETTCTIIINETTIKNQCTFEILDAYVGNFITFSCIHNTFFNVYSEQTWQLTDREAVINAELQFKFKKFNINLNYLDYINNSSNTSSTTAYIYVCRAQPDPTNGEIQTLVTPSSALGNVSTVEIPKSGITNFNLIIPVNYSVIASMLPISYSTDFISVIKGEITMSEIACETVYLSTDNTIVLTVGTHSGSNVDPDTPTTDPPEEQTTAPPVEDGTYEIPGAIKIVVCGQSYEDAETFRQAAENMQSSFGLTSRIYKGNDDETASMNDLLTTENVWNSDTDNVLYAKKWREIDTELDGNYDHSWATSDNTPIDALRNMVGVFYTAMKKNPATGKYQGLLEKGKYYSLTINLSDTINGSVPTYSLYKNSGADSFLYLYHECQACVWRTFDGINNSVDKIKDANILYEIAYVDGIDNNVSSKSTTHIRQSSGSGMNSQHRYWNDNIDSYILPAAYMQYHITPTEQLRGTQDLTYVRFGTAGVILDIPALSIDNVDEPLTIYLLVRVEVGTTDITNDIGSYAFVDDSHRTWVQYDGAHPNVIPTGPKIITDFPRLELTINTVNHAESKWTQTSSSN